MRRNRLETALTLLVVLHLLGNLWHGAAHQAMRITLPPWKTAFVVVSILLPPPIGAFLLWTRRSALGAWITGLSMVSSLVFGLYHHYVLISPDHVSHYRAQVGRL